MTRLLAPAALLTGLVACTALEMSGGLDQLVGGNIQVAIGQLGPPAVKEVGFGSTSYIWISSSPDGSSACTLEIDTDSGGIIDGYKWQGSKATCAPFVAAFAK